MQIGPGVVAPPAGFRRLCLLGLVLAQTSAESPIWAPAASSSESFARLLAGKSEAFDIAQFRAKANLTNGPICEVNEKAPVWVQNKIQQRNCMKVERAIATYISLHSQEHVFSLLGNFTKDQVVVWKEQSLAAYKFCKMANDSFHSNRTLEAAHFAVNAWGQKIMSGKECCNQNTPPYCLDNTWSISTLALVAVAVIIVGLFLGSVIFSIFRPMQYAETKEERRSSEGGPAVEDKISPGQPEPQVESDRLRAQLEEAWMRKSCLRALPGHEAFAKATARIFAELHERFDFQRDNVLNQHEHLLSLWRSMCCMVADRAIEKGIHVEERTLLEEGLEEFRHELLEGFYTWRTRMAQCPDTRMDVEDYDEDDFRQPPSLGGSKWLPRGAPAIVGDDSGQSTLLAELITFLLVWGEAGNIRFMPEAVYLIAECTLSADDMSCSALYGNAPRYNASAPGASKENFRSGLFLSKIIRPIYNVVFDEWYEYVEGKGKAKDKKVLRKGFENFLPPDVNNYDDWDELFCNPEHLCDNVVLRDGTLLFDLEHAERFKELCNVDWHRSLHETKTHREVHSLWGVFAATHRIIFLHLLLFFSGMVLSASPPPVPMDKQVPIGGQTLIVRFAAVGLLVPIQGLMWTFARYETTGAATRRRDRGLARVALFALRTILLFSPLVTYFFVRWADWQDVQIYGQRERGDDKDWNRHKPLVKALAFHYIFSTCGICFLLFFSYRSSDKLFPMTHIPLRLRCIRNIFWFVVILVKFAFATMILREVFNALDELDLSMLGQETVDQIEKSYFSTAWCAHMLVWLMVWFMTLLLFIGDTQLWFTLGCSILGLLSYLVQRRCRVLQFALEDAIAKIPERFSLKVLTYSPTGLEMHNDEEPEEAAYFSAQFPALWDRIVEYMRYEDKIDQQLRGDMSFNVAATGIMPTWGALTGPEIHGAPIDVRPVDQTAAGSGQTFLSFHPSKAPDKLAPSSMAAEGRRTQRVVNLPEIFRKKTACESFFQDLNPSNFGPSNPEVQWRLKALSRGLGLPMPRPYRCPYIPGITVLIPHYGESILLVTEDVYNPKINIPLIDWVKTKYEDEFRAFTSRMQSKRRNDWPVAGSNWIRYTDAQWDKVCAWASMRMQTLWRTVAGMYLYLPALQAHYEIQGDKNSLLARNGIWDPADCFTLIVSMQMYHFFDDTQLEHTNRMFEKFGKCLKVAYISCQDKNATADLDNIARNQQRRYFSCLIDSTCEKIGETKRLKPMLTIELPGFPILGDGKGDNQNHAIPFTRGMFNQCIDANQGAYFEQMLLLPCAMGEFRTRWPGDSHSKRIIGFPEHITSDIGSIGDFAASAELAFGTLLQRTYAVLGARMHYGHPDLMSKIWMIQQGGVSKATKTLNLSEDIFAGMDFTLRGNKRKIRHCEYFHLAKGRDLGFNAVLGFFSKLSSGAGEQILTRQMFRLHQLLYLPESLTFFYAHVGYYFTQFFVSLSMPMVMLVWLLLLLTDCHSKFSAFESCGDAQLADNWKAAEVMTRMLGTWFSALILFFIITSISPMFLQVWMENRLVTAVGKVLKQFLTLSPLLFLFQAKTIGFYVMNELRYGGATYVATGRGLPTERRPFVGKPQKTGFRLEKVGGLYLDYAHIAYYDGCKLLMMVCLVILVGGVSNAGKNAFWTLRYLWLSLILTITSWLYAPFIFNPYQFDWTPYSQDVRAWVAFFCEDGGKHWIDWYNKNHLKPRKGLRHSIIDISFFMRCFWVTIWFTAVNLKLHIMFAIYDKTPFLWLMYIGVLCPPFVLSSLFCTSLSSLETMVGCTREYFHRRRVNFTKMFSNNESSSDGDESAEESADDIERILAAERRPTAEDEPVATDSDSDGESRCCFTCKQTPVAFVSVLVVWLDIFEVCISLYPFYWVRWTNGWVAAFVLKLTIAGMMFWLAEGILKSAEANKLGCLLQPLQTWVYSHRMARDLCVSFLILSTLGVCVLLNLLNDVFLPGCSIHQLLVYRDPGHLQRKEAVVVDIEHSDFGTPISESDGDYRLLASTGSPGSMSSPPNPVQVREIRVAGPLKE